MSNITRRSFLQKNTAAAATLTIVPSAVLGKTHGHIVPTDKLNIMGGAIALGHPLGATGTRLVASAISGLKKRKGRRALVTLCIGGGQAIAYEIENAE